MSSDLGISGSSALARTLSPVAEPLFIASALLLVLGALACSRLVALLTVAGSTLLYLSMFQLASGGTGGGSMSMMSMQQPHDDSSALHADATSFYLGLALLVVALGLSVWRRRRRGVPPSRALAPPRPSLTGLRARARSGRSDVSASTMLRTTAASLRFRASSAIHPLRRGSARDPFPVREGVSELIQDSDSQVPRCRRGERPHSKPGVRQFMGIEGLDRPRIP